MCGISGLILHPNTSNYFKEVDNQRKANLFFLLKNSLLSIQHRGYDGAGLVCAYPHNARFKVGIHKAYGMIHEVLDDELINRFGGDEMPFMGIAHTRYKTKGEWSSNESQPILGNIPSETKNMIALIHNGQVETSCSPDSIYLMQIIENYIRDNLDSIIKDNENSSLFDLLLNAVFHIMKTVKGSYSCLLMIENLGMIAFRDPRGIRPLSMAISQNYDYAFCSESIGLDNIGQDSNSSISSSLFKWKEMRDIRAGECVIIQTQKNGYPIYNTYQYRDDMMTRTSCIFEYIYLADRQSRIDGLLVEKSREILGQLLADKIKREKIRCPDQEEEEVIIDIVIPIPQTSCVAARACAMELMDVEYNDQLIRLNPNRVKQRSFILPTQEEREKAVLEKFIIPENMDFKGKNIMLIDDSIVRGTTLKHIVRRFRESNYNIGKIVVGSVAPAIKHQNIYGIDIPDTERLIAYRRTDEEIARVLNVDCIIYQDLEIMLNTFRNILKRDFEYSMFVEQ